MILTFLYKYLVFLYKKVKIFTNKTFFFFLIYEDFSNYRNDQKHTANDVS